MKIILATVIIAILMRKHGILEKILALLVACIVLHILS